MHLDVQDLRNFYYREPLGRAAQRAMRNKVLQFSTESRSLLCKHKEFLCDFLSGSRSFFH